jgi:tRNA(fMet)-specific endonuclease VapC
MRYLVDTNTCIHAMRGVKSVIDTMSSIAPNEIAISSVTCYELYTGVEKCVDSDRERAKVGALIERLVRLPFDLNGAQHAARIRATLEARGEMIGPYEVLIAGHATSLGLSLVSSNTSEFDRVPDLTVLNWYV